MDKKLCNYCGSDDLEIGSLHDPSKLPVKQYYVQCKDCGACGPFGKDEKWAIIKWNSRIQEVPEKPKENDILPERSQVLLWSDAVSKICPFKTKPQSIGHCSARDCMMWVSVGNDKGRCGLANTPFAVGMCATSCEG